MVLIIGSGLIGSILAIRLSQLNIPVKLFDKIAFDTPKPRDGRTIAVTYGSKKFLEKCGLWNNVQNFAQSIQYIRVFEQDSAWTIDYDAKEFGPHPMGYIVEFDRLRDVIIDGLKNAANLEIFSPVSITGITQKTEIVEAHTLDHGTIQGQLLVGADGKNSWIRSHLNIQSTIREYNHQALVAHFIHEKPHQDTAWEIFHTNGPFAMLPMLPTADGKHQSGIVWFNKKSTKWENITDQELECQIEDIFPFYGTVKLNSKRWTFPIVALNVDKIIDQRTVLVGDAAHAIHPVAGQGANLGWRDIEILSEMAESAHALGQDLGSQIFLNMYRRKRLFDHQALFSITHGLIKLFSTNNSGVSFLRQLGFATINRIAPLKHFFIKRASGI